MKNIILDSITAVALITFIFSSVALGTTSAWLYVFALILSGGWIVLFSFANGWIGGEKDV